MAIADLTISIDLLDAAACRDTFARFLHPHGPVCHSCGISIIGVKAETFRSGGKVECHSCGKWIRLRSGSVLENTNADWRQLAMLVALTNACRPYSEIAHACKMSEDSVRRYQRRLMLTQ